MYNGAENDGGMRHRLFCLLNAKVSETTSSRHRAYHGLENRVPEVRTHGAEGERGGQYAIPASIHSLGINVPKIHIESPVQFKLTEWSTKLLMSWTLLSGS